MKYTALKFGPHFWNTLFMRDFMNQPNLGNSLPGLPYLEKDNAFFRSFLILRYEKDLFQRLEPILF